MKSNAPILDVAARDLHKFFQKLGVSSSFIGQLEPHCSQWCVIVYLGFEDVINMEASSKECSVKPSSFRNFTLGAVAKLPF